MDQPRDAHERRLIPVSARALEGLAETEAWRELLRHMDEANTWAILAPCGHAQCTSFSFPVPEVCAPRFMN